MKTGRILTYWTKQAGQPLQLAESNKFPVCILSGRLEIGFPCLYQSIDLQVSGFVEETRRHPFSGRIGRDGWVLGLVRHP